MTGPGESRLAVKQATRKSFFGGKLGQMLRTAEQDLIASSRGIIRGRSYDGDALWLLRLLRGAMAKRRFALQNGEVGQLLAKEKTGQYLSERELMMWVEW